MASKPATILILAAFDREIAALSKEVWHGSLPRDQKCAFIRRINTVLKNLTDYKEKENGPEAA